MGNNSVPKFIFRLSRFPVYRGSVLGRFYCIWILLHVTLNRYYSGDKGKADKKGEMEQVILNTVLVRNPEGKVIVGKAG